MFIQRVRTAAGEAQLKQLIQDHVERTGEAPTGQMSRTWVCLVFGGCFKAATHTAVATHSKCQQC